MLYKAKNGKLEVIAGTTVASGDTSPIGTTMLYDGKEVPTGWQEVEEVYSNPNMLINSDFRNLINQRGQKIYTADNRKIYTIDRWCIVNAELKVLDGSLEFSTNADKGWMTQFAELNLINKCVSASFCINGKIYKYITVVDANYEKYYLADNFKVYIKHNEGRNALEFSFEIENGITLNLEWVKLEQGSITTPFVPRGYGEELALCQRYYEIVEFLERTAYDAGKKWYTGERFIVTKRAIPTISSFIFYANSSVMLTNADFGTFQPTKESTGNISTKTTYNYIKGVFSFDAEIY